MALDTHGELLVGRYRKVGAIGVGGMARVYLAHDELLGRRVAIKLLHADSPDDAAIRFQREAKLGASLNHPNLVSIFDIVTDDESILIVMEYVDGETLKDAVARGPLPPERAVEVIRDVAAGLDHAHAQGVVHRDVKPANILLRQDGIAKVADLGIATAAERTAITRSDVVLGTASYMAPEQLTGDTAGPRSDVYALAAVAYEALSGRKARTGKTPVEVAHEVVSGPPPDLGAVWPDAPPAVAKALVRGMARNPEDRSASAGALARDLERALRSRPKAAAPIAATAPLSRPQAVVPAPERAAPDRRRAPASTPPPSPRRTSIGRSWAARAAVLALIAIAAIAGFAVLGSGDGGRETGQGEQAAREQGGREQRSSSRRESGAGQAQSEQEGSAAETPPSDAPPSDAPPGGAAAESPPAEPDATATTDDPVALNDEGYALLQAGAYDDAIPLLERAVAAFPEGSQELTYAYALYNLGRALRLAGRADEAVPILERRLQIPNQTETVQRELDAARAAAG
jgi:eukaryotic-like serine/threonine-protein kinase